MTPPLPTSPRSNNEPEELARARRELSRTRPERLRIVIAGDPRRPLRSFAFSARLPTLIGGAVAIVFLAALGLAVAAWNLRGWVQSLQHRVSAMTAAADEFSRHPLPRLASTAGAPLDLVGPHGRVRPEETVPPERLAHFSMVSVNTGETIEVFFDRATGEPDIPSYRALRRFMRCQRTTAETPIDPRLIELLYTISQRTGQRIELVSGFRAPMYSTATLSYHTRGMAADIRIPGMTPLMVRDLAMSLGVKGIGYYPVSRFVHVDVRDDKAYWIDTGEGKGDDDSATHGVD
jgi:uncharacterized protein YcbK (DUF882 family)